MVKNSLTDFINKRVTLSQSVVDDLKNASEEIRVRKNHYLLKEGQIPNYIWFISEGSVRVFYEHDDKEITSWIYNKEQIVTAYGCFFSQKFSYDNIQCTEDCVVTRVSYDKLQGLYKIHPAMETFGRIWMEEMVAGLDTFYKGYMFMSAKEKYALLLSYFPDVTQRVNLGHIASFLGISQETLSRIRRK